MGKFKKPRLTCPLCFQEFTNSKFHKHISLHSSPSYYYCCHTCNPQTRYVSVNSLLLHQQKYQHVIENNVNLNGTFVPNYFANDHETVVISRNDEENEELEIAIDSEDNSILILTQHVIIMQDNEHKIEQITNVTIPIDIRNTRNQTILIDNLCNSIQDQLDSFNIPNVTEFQVQNNQMSVVSKKKQCNTHKTHKALLRWILMCLMQIIIMTI